MAQEHVHGDRGVFHAGTWVDIEDLLKSDWCPLQGTCSGDNGEPVPSPPPPPGFDADVVIIGAGCIGGAVARELSRYSIRVILVESSDDVSQGATKGNSGIVHAGFDDAPGSQRARFCWPGNQMFTQLDKELRFGLQRNGSLVVARGPADEATLAELLERGRRNGVERLRIVGREELRAMEPHIASDATAALFSPDAATLIPYEFAIALAENAVDNGVELRLNSRVTGIDKIEGGGFVVHTRVAAGPYAAHAPRSDSSSIEAVLALALSLVGVASVIAVAVHPPTAAAIDGLVVVPPLLSYGIATDPHLAHVYRVVPMIIALTLAAVASVVLFGGEVLRVLGGKGSGGHRRHHRHRHHGAAATRAEAIRARFIVNAAGCGSDEIARLLGDASFVVKPRLGEYLLLRKEEGRDKARHILFPAPSKMGKGVLVQKTLWGNLILGPTAADVGDPATAKRTPAEIMSTILSKCRELVPAFDAGAVIHSFAGARAKSSRGDWVIERCATAPDAVHAAGIDSPGLAGSPAIALEVVRLLADAGLAPRLVRNPLFNPQRRAIITPKVHSKVSPQTALLDASAAARGTPVRTAPLRIDSEDPRTNLVCKCERVSEAEVAEALRRSLPAGSTQAVRKRTRAGMGHCQGEFCEKRVRAIIAQHLGVPVAAVPGRPWPATSLLPERWLSEEDKDAIRRL